MEAGEAVEAAVRRELAEETGLSVGNLHPLGVFRPSVDSPFELSVFAAELGDGVPIAGDDASQADLVPLDRVLQRPLTPGAAGWIVRAILALSGLGAVLEAPA